MTRLQRLHLFVNGDVSGWNFSLLLLIQLYLGSRGGDKRRVLRVLMQLMYGSIFPLQQDEVGISTASDICGLLRSALLLEPEGFDIECQGTKKTLDLKYLMMLWEITSFESLREAVRNISAPVSGGTPLLGMQLSHRSHLGRFVQRFATALSTLNMEEENFLFEGYCSFRELTRDRYQEQLHFLCRDGRPTPRRDVGSSDIRDSELFNSLANTQDGISADGFSGTNQKAIAYICGTEINRVIDNQIQFLEKSGFQTPSHIKDVLQSVLAISNEKLENSTSSRFDAALYLAYLEQLSKGDYLEAMNCLHLFFDRMVSQGSKFFYHFALIFKAALHRLFDEDESSMDSICEAITVARENKDYETLANVLTWLFEFLEERPHLRYNIASHHFQNREQLLQSLMKGRKALVSPLLFASARHELEHSLQCGTPYAEAEVMLMKATFIALQVGESPLLDVFLTSAHFWQQFGVYDLEKVYVKMGLKRANRLQSTNVHRLLIFSHALSSLIRGYLPQAPTSKETPEECTMVFCNHHDIRDLRVFISCKALYQNGNHTLAIELLKSINLPSARNKKFSALKIGLEARILYHQGRLRDALKVLNDAIKTTEVSDAFSTEMLKNDLAFVKYHGCSVEGAFSGVVQQIQACACKDFMNPFLEAATTLVTVIFGDEEKTIAYQLCREILPISIWSDDILALARTCLYLSEAYLKEAKDALHHFGKESALRLSLAYLEIAVATFKQMGILPELAKSFAIESQIAEAFAGSSDDALKGLQSHAEQGMEYLRIRKLQASNSHVLF